MPIPDTPLPECTEGPAAFERFDATMGALLSVPRATYEKREKEYKKRSAAKTNRPGPKPKVKKGAR